MADLICEVSEEVATQISKICSRRQPHSHWGTPANTPVCVWTRPRYIFPETRLVGLHFVAACMGLSSFKFVQWAPKDASVLQQSPFWPFKVVQGHPRSMILVPIESEYVTSD